MPQTIKNRREYLFLYDISFANPNGDPNDGNKPRIDEETGKNIVTDVRLKRTVRDYLLQKGHEIFVREVENGDDGIQDGKDRVRDFIQSYEELKDKSLRDQKEIISRNILRSCIDVRLFGGTLPVELKVKNKKESSSITHTGPVQFGMGVSLHRVKLEFIKGTGAFASKSGQKQKTFREEWFLPYSLIAFYGIANEYSARATDLTDEDLEELKEALWHGTKNLITRSKMGQTPRLLVEIVYKEGIRSQIGELHRYIKLESDKNDESLRSPEDYTLNIDRLLDVIKENSDKIEAVNYKVDRNFRLSKSFQSENLGVFLQELAL